MTRAQIRAEERRWRRGDVATVAAALFIGVLFAWIVIAVQDMRDDLHVANAARDALAQQVEQLGGDPVSGPPGSRGEPGASVTGPPGPSGPQGVPGPRGPSGTPGRAGAAGDDGAAGPEGEAGTDGEAGAPGAAGTDGVQGPQGEPGPGGPAGPAGPAGPQGEQGPRGEQGPAGPSCPAGYSLQPPPDDPDALVCRRDSAPEDGGEDSESPGPLALALDPSRRQYP
ncbi:hypothetical protein SEA_ONIONKNIGHT_25 [Streptomyces phage OnionKnight]|nr:hypothetical protein SEA_ONIONKNIGHT_25 [Streptomyces phage OnionKnight]